MSQVEKFLSGMSNVGEYVSNQFYFTKLKDTPTGYLGHSGDYLVVNDNESGIHFTGIEKIAQDLTDYGFSAGETTFTGLSDTPSDFTAGKYLRVNDAGDALEYVDITGVSSGSSGGGSNISTLNTIQENIDNIPLIGSGVQIPDAILVKDTTATTTNGADNLIQLDFGGWSNAYDANGNITTKHFAYETNNYVSKRWYIRFNSVNGSYISNSEDQHVKKEFNSIQEYISNDRALYFGGGGGGNYEFCRSAFSSSSAIGHTNSHLDLDPNQLTTNSQDWTHTDTTLNVVGIKIPEDGLYNLNLHIAASISSSAFSHWMNNISLFEGTLYRVKPDGTTNLLLLKQESKNTGNGTHISVDLAQDNEYLEAGDFLFIKSQLYDNTASSTTFPIEGKSFFSISKAGAGGSGLSGGSTDFISLTDTPVDYIGHSGDYMIVNDNEAGIHFTGIEKIAQDLTDYGFSAGETTFTGLSDTPSDFTAGKYLRVNDAGDALEYVDITGVSSGGGGSVLQFCKAFAAAGQTFSHQENGVTNVNLDTNNLTQESQNWLHTDTTLNVVGIKIPEDGLYNINTNLSPSRIPWTNWQQDVLNLSQKLLISKANGTSEVLGESTEAKTTSSVMSNGALLTVDFSLDHVYLQKDDFIYMSADAWLMANKTTQHGIDEGFTYISVAKAGSSGSGGNYEFCTVGINGTQNFTNSQTWVNFNGSLSDGSTDLTYLVSSLNAYGLRPSTNGYYNINAAIKSIHSSTNQAASEMHVYVYRHSIDTGSNSLIGYSTEFWEDGGGYNGPQCQVNVPDQYLTTNHVVLIRLYGWRNSTTFSIPLETSLAYTFLNLSRADIGGGSGGSTTFTGLSDTPSDFTAGKYLRVNDAGDALEYVDITGGGTSYIDSVVTKIENGPIDKRSTDTTASSTNYYRVPVESLRFDDLEVGATYRINVSLLGYHGSDDLGVNLIIRNRASSFSSDINLDLAGINNYNNNGGDPDPAVISIASVGNDTTLYGETHSQTKIFEATGTHLDVLADSISSNSFFRNIIIQLEKITVGGGGGNYEFCKAYFAANQPSPGNGGVSPINLNSSSLETESQNWTFLSPTYNKIGIKIQTDGLYNIVGEALIDLSDSSTQSDWVSNAVNHSIEVKDENGNRLAFSHNNKEAGNGESLKADIYAANVYLTAGTILTVHSSHFRVGGGGSYVYRTNTSYLNVEKAGVGGSGSGYTTFTGLNDTPTGYQSGYYLISNETGIEYQSITGLADALIDYGFSAGGTSFFTGLKDTPTGYQSGYYLRSTETGIEYIDATGLAADISDEIVNTIVTGQFLDFTGLKDTPTGYYGYSGYYLIVDDYENKINFTGIDKIASDLLANGFLGVTNIIKYSNSLPDPTENDGKIVSLGCDLYYSCDGQWQKVGENAIPAPENIPDCVNNFKEYTQYQEYKDSFLAENNPKAFDKMLNFNEDISDLIYDVCLFSNNELSSVKIDETTYKWGMFAETQTVNITATPGVVDDRDIEFMGWAGGGAMFGDVNSAQTTLLVDKDLSVTGYFSEIFQTTCEDISLHIQSDTTDANTIFTDLSSNTYPITVAGNIQHSTTDAYLGNTSITFDGVGDYLTVGNLEDFKFLHDGSSDYTIEFWTKIQETPASIDLDHPNAGSVGTQLGYVAGKPENMFDGSNSTYYGINNVKRLDRFYMRLATWFTQPITNVDRIDWRYLVDECCGHRGFLIHNAETNAWVSVGSGPKGSSVQEAIFRKSPTFPPFDAIRLEYHGSSSGNRQFRNYEVRFYQNSSNSDIPTTRINPTTSSATILSTASAYNMHGINIAIQGNQLMSTIYNGTSSPYAGKLSTSTGIATDQWHHVALTYYQGKYNLYLDGVFQQGQISISNASQNTQSKILKIGSSDNGTIFDFFKGNMQDMRITKKAIYSSNFKPPNSLLNNPC